MGKLLNTLFAKGVKSGKRRVSKAAKGGAKRVARSYQTGKSNKEWDKRYKALHPGKRNGYTERRRNRSDVNRKTRL